MFADIIVDISHEKVDRVFQYRVPQSMESMIRCGMEVQVPFGKSNHLISGYVMDLTAKAQWETDKIKEVAAILPKRVTADNNMIMLAAWMRETYGSTMIAALKTVMPVKQVMKGIEQKSIVTSLSTEELLIKANECQRKHYHAQEKLLRALADNPELPLALVTEKLHVSTQTVTSLVRQGVIGKKTESSFHNPIVFREGKDTPPVLSEEQEQTILSVLSDYERDCPGVYLLHGITGSGKTEVYMELIASMISRGKQAIMLIPEIALTYQTVLRFYRRFQNRVTVMHSKLSAGEKYSQMQRARLGEVDVIIGPRSALFTPFPNLGLIIIDEEHESTYKSESVPKYHARECAIQLAKMHNAGVVLGSATPSVESYNKAMTGEYKLFRMTKRLTGGTLPQVYTVDMREELKNNNRSIFSNKLSEMIENRIERGEQTILFLNRRGYAGFVSCRTCGKVIKCPHCDVSLSEHKNHKMVCHYCGYETASVHKCPSCGSPYVGGFKAGTQQVEEMIHKQFPMATVLRMDADTTKTKDSYERILSAFSNREADILLGTQMIVKGHDFPAVTLVGILAADLSLGANDYRAGERTFQLLTQAAGRAGRGTLAGEVVIQTYQPEHYAVVHAANQDYESFYREEIMYRQMLSYPPIAHIMAVLIQSKSEREAREMAFDLREQIPETIHGKKPVIVGPAPAGIGKINDMYRYVFYLKEKELQVITEMKDCIEQYMENGSYKKENLQFDLDPMGSF